MKRCTMLMSTLASTILLSTGAAFAVMPIPQGPEPYRAADPIYTPQTSEPTLENVVTTPPSLTDGKPFNGPAAGPEPYHAPNPS